MKKILILSMLMMVSGAYADSNESANSSESATQSNSDGSGVSNGGVVAAAVIGGAATVAGAALTANAVNNSQPQNNVVVTREPNTQNPTGAQHNWNNVAQQSWYNSQHHRDVIVVKPMPQNNVRVDDRRHIDDAHVRIHKIPQL